MLSYKLKEDEVVLYKGDVNLLDEGRTGKLILTNYNIVFVKNVDNNLEENNIDIYLVEDIKLYEGVPQIKSKGNKIEIYFRTTEREFSFVNKSDLHKFVNSAVKLRTGKTIIERSAEKVKGTIKQIDDSFEIDSVGMVKSAVSKVRGFGIKSIFKK